MSELFIWVPTKGWKLVRRFKTPEVARAFAIELEPLEVKVVDTKTGQAYWGGKCCMVDYSLPCAPRTI